MVCSTDIYLYMKSILMNILFLFLRIIPVMAQISFLNSVQEKLYSDKKNRLEIAEVYVCLIWMNRLKSLFFQYLDLSTRNVINVRIAIVYLIT